MISRHVTMINGFADALMHQNDYLCSMKFAQIDNLLMQQLIVTSLVITNSAFII